MESRPRLHAILPHPQRVFTFVAGKGFGEIPCFAVLTQSPNTSKRIHVISLVRATVWTECAVVIKSVVKLTSLKCLVKDDSLLRPQMLL